jgi:hypothetical protein
MGTQSLDGIPNRSKATVSSLISGLGEDVPIHYLDIRCGLGSLINIYKEFRVVMSPITTVMKRKLWDNVVEVGDSIVRTESWGLRLYKVGYICRADMRLTKSVLNHN